MSSTTLQEDSRGISLLIGLWGVTCGSMALALYMVFFYAPTEQTMGVVQRIFYFHVSTAWIAFLAFFLVTLFSVFYLAGGQRKWDRRAYAAAEIGTLFCSLVLVTGLLWAKPAWNVWWTWDIRLTTTLVLWILYAAYLLLRRYVLEGRESKLAAVCGILAFMVVPAVYFSIRWWRTLHPAPVLMGGDGTGVESRMFLTLLVSVLAFIFLFVYLFQHRVAIETMGDDLEEMRRNISEQERCSQSILIENQNFVIEEYMFKEYKKDD